VLQERDDRLGQLLVEVVGENVDEVLRATDSSVFARSFRREQCAS